MMKRLLALALVLSASTISMAREPIQAPPALGRVDYQAQYSPVPTPSIPPAPGTLHGDPPVISGAIIYDAQPGLSPIPADIQPGVVVCDACNGGHISLYKKVNVHHARKIHPCAVSKIVSVPDPCNPCKCVFIEICVPPCQCDEVVCHPRRNRTVFHYGEYSVKVTERNGFLVVNYDN